MGKQRVENGDGFLSIGEGGVVWRRGGKQRQGVERRPFHVVGIVPMYLCHAFGEGLAANRVVLLKVLVEGGQGINIGALARRAGQGLRLLHFRVAALQRFC